MRYGAAHFGFRLRQGFAAKVSGGNYLENTVFTSQNEASVGSQTLDRSVEKTAQKFAVITVFAELARYRIKQAQFFGVEHRRILSYFPPLSSIDASKIIKPEKRPA